MVFHSTVQPTAVNRDIRRYNLNTMEKVFSHVVGKFNDRQCLGTREIFGEEKEVQPDGKVHTKYNLGDYHWRSYRDFGDQAEKFGRGLREIGVESKQRVVMFAESRAEWMIAAYGCFQHSMSIVTLYTNLGDDGITHGLSETEVTTVICSWDTHGKLLQVLSKDRDKMPHVKNVVIMEDLAGKTINTSKCPEGVKCIRFKEVIAKGDVEKAVTRKSCPPGPDDIAIIMYTSGSTGKPKGVMLSHHNLVSAMGSLCNITDFKPETDRFIAFLPLAHVLELLAESSCLFYGIKIGYSSSLTLTTKSSKVKTGCKGDSNILKPTLMCAVPLILERIYKSMVETMKRKGWFVEELFHYLVAYKMKWQDRGFDTPLLNKTLFRRIRYFLGGKVRVLLSGGAPLASDTHSLCRTCLSMPVIQGYGLTETASCATVTHTRDRVCGRAGAPLMDVDIKLVDWEEGNYRVTDKPNPRGEVHVGGDNVAVGYYKLPDKTDEEFYTDEQGTRWFMTGDIGEVYPDGTLMIIDRKKDLVKLQFGEYVSLGKVEACLKGCPVISNICVYGSSSKSFVVAMICPAPHILKELAAAKHGKGDLTFEQMCEDKDVTGTALREIVNYGKAHKLEKFEIPGAIHLTPIEWTPDTGLTTAAMKLKRRPLQEYYQNDIDRMYGEK